MKKSAMVFAMVFAMVVVTGCAPRIKKDWVATSLNESGGLIEITYEFHPNEAFESSEQQGRDLAITICQAWGYNSAEQFGLEKEVCTDRTRTGFASACNNRRASKMYQCLGKGTGSARDLD